MASLKTSLKANYDRWNDVQIGAEKEKDTYTVWSYSSPQKYYFIPLSQS